MRSSTRFCLAFGLGAFVSVSAADTTEGGVEQVVVTAARAPLGLSRVGSATTVITAEDIRNRQLRYVTDALRTVPGFAVSHTGAIGAQTQVRVRGAEANHVLVLVDGVRANDPATGDEFRWEHLTTGNIERIEVVRGPQSVLWGSDAVAAVVHVITKQGYEASELDVYAEGGSDGTQNVGVQGGFGAERWRLSGGLERLATDGINISRSGNEEDDSDITTASVSLQLDPADNLSLDFGLRAVDAYSQFDPVDFFVTGLPVDGDVATETRQNYANARMRLSTRDGGLVHQLALHYFDSDNDNLTNGIDNSSTASDRFSVAYQANIPLGDNLLALAVEHEETQFEQRGAVIFGDPNQDQEMSVTSAIADFQGLALDKLTWLASARFDDNSDFDDAFTARLALAYTLTDGTTLRGSVGTGRKNPTFIERFGFFPGQFIGNPSLKPERSTSIDLGLDQRLLDDALVLEVTLFRQDLKDEIDGFVFDPTTFLSTAENITSSSERNGVELGARWTPLPQLTFTGSYTYTDSSAENAVGNDVRELRRPRHTASLVTNLSLLNDRAQVTLGVDYGGTRADLFFPPFPTPQEVVTLDRHLLVDLTAQLQITPRVSLFARGSNLLDEDYEQVFGYRTLGRAGYVGVRLNLQ